MADDTTTNLNIVTDPNTVTEPDTAVQQAEQAVAQAAPPEPSVAATLVIPALSASS